MSVLHSYTSSESAFLSLINFSFFSRVRIVTVSGRWLDAHPGMQCVMFRGSGVRLAARDRCRVWSWLRGVALCSRVLASPFPACFVSCFQGCCWPPCSLHHLPVGLKLCHTPCFSLLNKCLLSLLMITRLLDLIE